MIRSSASTVRARVYKRDRGVCALCGLDTGALETGRVADLPVHGERYVDAGRALWEADHIVPVAEGGGSCGLDNYRTLCVWCHPRETGKLRRRLNAARREIP